MKDDKWVSLRNIVENAPNEKRRSVSGRIKAIEDKIGSRIGKYEDIGRYRFPEGDSIIDEIKEVLREIDEKKPELPERAISLSNVICYLESLGFPHANKFNQEHLVHLKIVRNKYTEEPYILYDDFRKALEEKYFVLMPLMEVIDELHLLPFNLTELLREQKLGKVFFLDHIKHPVYSVDLTKGHIIRGYYLELIGKGIS